MTLGNNRGVKTGQWFANEILWMHDINFIGESTYKNITDLLAILAERGVASGSSPDIVISGLLLEFSATLTSNLRAGAAVSYQGYYLDSDGVWGFQSSAGDIFSVVVPDDQTVTVDAGGTQGRVDTIEVRPIEVTYNSQSRQFKDPVTEMITSAVVKTRKEYTVEVQILKGTEGASPVAPTHTAGWIKIAEVFVDVSATSITQSDIKDVRDSDLWTTEANDVKYTVFFIEEKRVVANKADLPDDVSEVKQGDTYMVLCGAGGDAGPTGGNQFVYMDGLYGEFGGWFDLDRAGFCNIRWRGLADMLLSAAGWIGNAVPGADDRVAVTTPGLTIGTSVTVRDWVMGLCPYACQGMRDINIDGEVMIWTTAHSGSLLRIAMNALDPDRDVKMCEGNWRGWLEICSGTNDVYMSGNLFCVGDAGSPPIMWLHGKLYVEGHTLHWIGDTGTEKTITMTAGAIDNQVAGGLIVMRGKLALNTLDQDLEDVRLKDFFSSTYIKQLSDCTVGVLTIDAGCTWDRNGFTLVYDTLVNNGTLI